MKNNDHDLVHQLSEKLDSLWRYDDYIKNSKDCKECAALWKKLKKSDLEMVGMLKEEIKSHVKSGKFEVCEGCFVEKK